MVVLVQLVVAVVMPFPAGANSIFDYAGQGSGPVRCSLSKGESAVITKTGKLTFESLSNIPVNKGLRMVAALGAGGALGDYLYQQQQRNQRPAQKRRSVNMNPSQYYSKSSNAG